jgi:uncharacterized protein (DUF362 family)
MKQKEITRKILVSEQTSVHITGISAKTSKSEKIVAIQQGAVAATDFSWLKSGESVFIKPVVNSGNSYPATTDPLAVTALIRLLKQKGAGRIVVGDLAGIGDVRFYENHLEGSTLNLMERTGIAQATLRDGAELFCFEEAGWDGFYPETPIRGSHWKKPLMIPSILKEMDHIILLPRCARHLMASSTLGMKTAIGYLRTDTRMELHRDAQTFHEKIAETNAIPTLLKKQRLVLTVADKVLTTFGPNEGYVIQPSTGLIISSNSIIAHDMVSLAWLLENRKNTPQQELKNHSDVNKRTANTSNRYTVFILSRKLITSLRSETLRKADLKTIWDDPVLKHAFTIFDGIPQIVIQSTNNIISKDLLNTLQKAVLTL